jgi:hypothetical protein
VTFHVKASGTAPLAYQWQRNGVDIAGATASSYTRSSVSQTDNGAQFRVVVRNSYGSTTSNAATLTVTSNQPPTGTITAPTAGSFYSAGQTISYAGTGTDPEDGTLPASAFTWRVDFHHDVHLHPFIPDTAGAQSGTFVVPNTGHTSANVWYRIHLTVSDSSGRTHSSHRDISPRTTQITVASQPSGLQVTLDGQPVTAPHTVTSVVGIKRQIGAVSPQDRSGVTYGFGSWSDGGAQQHEITTGSANTTYTATFTAGSTSPFLSDRTPTFAMNGWGPWEKDRSNGEHVAGDGRVITLNGTTYTKGLGVHGPSELRFHLGGSCSSFTAQVGLDDEVANSGSVIFQVFADGGATPRFDSGLMTGASTTKAVNVPLTGVNELRLVVTNGGDHIHYDHANWADAQINCGSAVPPPTTPLPGGPPPAPQATPPATGPGTTTFLSDRAWASMTNGWGPAELDRSNGEVPAGDGRVLSINGIAYTKGIGTHAPSEIRYLLDRACTTFSAIVGIDDEVTGGKGSAVFQVFVDREARPRFESGLMTAASVAQVVNVPITGVNELRLVVTHGGDHIHYDHADWADAKVTCG